MSSTSDAASLKRPLVIQQCLVGDAMHTYDRLYTLIWKWVAHSIHGKCVQCRMYLCSLLGAVELKL